MLEIIIMEQYIKNFKTIRDDYATYATKRIYTKNQNILKKIRLILAVCVPFIALKIFSLSELNDYFWIGLCLFCVLVLAIIFNQSKKNVKVNLYFNRIDQNLTITIDENNQKSCSPLFIKADYHMFGETAQNPLPMIIFNIYIVDQKGEKAFILGSIDCSKMLITKALFDEILFEYQPLIQWLDLPIYKQIDRPRLNQFRDLK